MKKQAFGNNECERCGVRHPHGSDCPSFGTDWSEIFERARIGPEDIAPTEVATMEADAWRSVCEQLKAEKELTDKLCKAIQRIFNKAVPHTTLVEQGEEYVGSYVVPCGPIHMAIGLAGRDDAIGDDKREAPKSVPSLSPTQARGASSKKPSPPQTC